MALREVLAHFGFTIDRSNLDAAGRGIEKVKKETHEAGAGLNHFVEGLRGAVAAVAAGAFVEFTNSIREQAAALKDTSEQTGLATDELQAWTLQAQLGGATAQDFTNGLRKLSKELATGVDESGQQSKLFKNLKISTKDAHGEVRTLSDVLPEIAEHFKGLKSGAEKSALAQQIFGRSGTKLVPILSEGAEGVAKLRAQFDALGGGFSAEAIERADEYDDALVKLNFSFFSFKSLLATEVFPWLAKTVDQLTAASVGATKWIKETTGLSTAVKFLATIIGGTLLKALAPFLLPGLKFIAIFLAVDDLIGFLQGKDSVIGAILNSWFGDGTATVVRKWCNDGAAVIKGVFIGAIDLLRLAFASTNEESDKLWQHFEAATRPVEAILDSIVSKIKLIKDAFSDIDTLKQGANDLLDTLTSPFDSDEENARKDKARDERRIRGAGLDPNAKVFDSGAETRGTVDIKAVVRDLYGAVRGNPALAGLPEDYDSPNKDRRGQGPRAYTATTTVPTAAQAIYNYNPNIQINQEIKARVDAQQMKEASRAAVKDGLAEYRAAIENLEQRSLNVK